jgi:hypothetical protein
VWQAELIHSGAEDRSTSFLRLTVTPNQHHAIDLKGMANDTAFIPPT